jgi:ABC-type transporter Mla maintaining outer membrane lipid asymmetry permease subunit MlaE
VLYLKRNGLNIKSESAAITDTKWRTVVFSIIRVIMLNGVFYRIFRASLTIAAWQYCNRENEKG